MAIFTLSAAFVFEDACCCILCIILGGFSGKVGYCGEGGGGSLKGGGSISEMDERICPVKVMGEKLIFAIACLFRNRLGQKG